MIYYKDINNEYKPIRTKDSDIVKAAIELKVRYRYARNEKMAEYVLRDVVRKYGVDKDELLVMWSVVEDVVREYLLELR